MPKRILSIAILCGLFSACLGDDIVRIKINPGDKVVFNFSGAGTLGRFYVQDITADRNGKFNNQIVWEIMPLKGRLEGRWVFDIESIEYGKIPDGYKQILPADGAAKKLQDGEYMAMPETVSAGYRPVFFAIKNGVVSAAESQKD